MPGELKEEKPQGVFSWMFGKVKNAVTVTAKVTAYAAFYGVIKPVNFISRTAKKVVSKTASYLGITSRIKQVETFVSRAPDVQEFRQGVRQTMGFVDGEKNLAASFVEKNLWLGFKTFSYYYAVDPVLSLLFSEDSYKLQAVRTAVLSHLISETAGIAIEAAGLYILLGNQYAKKNPNPLYKPTDDTNWVKVTKANIGSGVYYLSFKLLTAVLAKLWQPLGHFSSVIVEGNALMEFRLTNLSSDHRYKILSGQIWFCLPLGVSIVFPAVLVRHGILALTGIDSNIIQNVLQNCFMLYGLHNIYNRTQPFPSEEGRDVLLPIRLATTWCSRQLMSTVSMYFNEHVKVSQEGKHRNSFDVRYSTSKVYEFVDKFEYRKSTYVLYRHDQSVDLFTHWTLRTHRAGQNVLDCVSDQSVSLIPGLSSPLKKITRKNIEENSIPEKQKASIQKALTKYHEERLCEEVFDEMGGVVSELAECVLGDRFSNLQSFMQIEVFKQLIEPHQQSIQEALKNVKWVQGSPKLHYVLSAIAAWMPDRVFPPESKLRSSHLTELVDLFYASFAKVLVKAVHAKFGCEFVRAPEETPNLVEDHFTQESKKDNKNSGTKPSDVVQTNVITSESKSESNKQSTQVVSFPPLSSSYHSLFSTASGKNSHSASLESTVSQPAMIDAGSNLGNVLSDVDSDYFTPQSRRA